MNDQLVWQDSYELGVDIIDNEHQRLFKIINKLFALKADEKDSHWACQEGIKYFHGHALRHFTDEETYMASINYDGLERHRHIHQDFRQNILPALEQELERTGYSPQAVEHFLSVCSGWLIGHTLTEDAAIASGEESTWENLLPSEEVAAMKKVIIQLVFDLFHLESQLISEAYGGERFGKGVYYRLIYGKEGEAKRQEVMMVFEEDLLINTVGHVLGLQSNKLDSMLINAARYTAKQFVGRVMEHFPEQAGFRLLEENLLSYDQFREIFRRETPQVSLLFNTGGAGYFAYCVIAPHLLQEGVSGTPIKHDNAMTEVENYLSQHKKEDDGSRWKILVVDDSATIRLNMERLLEGDYAVSVAESGVSAIRALTLDRPDLILLDYEMPICDGKRTMEMLRSEPAFAQIPVIFLTGRSDPELVRSLLALKPAGFLLKYLRPAELKKKIDLYFEKQQPKA